MISQNAVTASPDLDNQSRPSPMSPMSPMGLIYPKTGYHPPGDDP